MRDPEWKDIEQELKREIPVDPAAVRRVMRRVREAAQPPWPVRAWHWFVRPRPVRISPLAGTLAAAAMAALLLVSPRGPAGHPPDGAMPPGAIVASGEPGEGAGFEYVQFVLVADGASQVSLVGDFNDWNPQAMPLQRSEEAGVWSVVVPLRHGAYVYAFVVNGTEWVVDALAPRAPEEGFGGPSSVILVGEEV